MGGSGLRRGESSAVQRAAAKRFRLKEDWWAVPTLREGVGEVGEFDSLFVGFESVHGGRIGGDVGDVGVLGDGEVEGPVGGVNDEAAEGFISPRPGERSQG